MAIWQFNLTLVPKNSIIAKYNHIPDQLFVDQDGWDDYFAKSNLEEAYNFEDAFTINWWNGLKVTVDQLLPALKSISESLSHIDGLRYFGDTDTNNICVCYENNTNQIEELNCRIDLRKSDRDFINSLLSLATRFNCLFMDKRGRLFEPNMSELANAIASSNAYRFVRDPEKFLNDLSSGVINPE